jgi:hypothetical protein
MPSGVYIRTDEYRRKKSKEMKGKKKALKETSVDMNTQHKRIAREREIINCFICGMKNDEHKKIYNCRLHLHCRDGNWANTDFDNWIIVCQKDHSKLDRLDFRGKGNKYYSEGIKGYVRKEK